MGESVTTIEEFAAHRRTANSALKKTLKNVDRNPQARVNPVVHVVAAIAVHDVNVIGVTPAYRPGIDEAERISAIREAPIPVIAFADVESVIVAKIGGVMGV